MNTMEVTLDHVFHSADLCVNGVMVAYVIYHDMIESPDGDAILLMDAHHNLVGRLPRFNSQAIAKAEVK